MLRVASAPAQNCPACGGNLRESFAITVLGDTKAVYHNCETCDSLAVIEPTWLERSYATVLYPDPDTGALRRTLFVYRFIRRMRAVGLLRKKYRSLDYGCGLGMLVSLQQDLGAEAVGYDQYSQPRFAQLTCGSELPNAKFDLVSAIEVIEHMTDPVQVFATIRDHLTPSGIVLITTELFDRKRIPDPSRWHYLAPEHGQHIMLFSPRGLAKAADSAGLKYVTSIVWSGMPFVHLFCMRERSISALRIARLRWHNFIGERLSQSDCIA